MDPKLKTLILAITLITIWYAIHIWLLWTAAGSLSGLCAGSLQHSTYHTHLVRRSSRSLHSHHRLWCTHCHTVESNVSGPIYVCYQLPYWLQYDVESVWQLVQRHGGSVSCLQGGCYDYYIASQYVCILLVAFPLLRPQPQKDLYF